MKKLLVFFACIVGLLVSCSKTSEQKVEYIPFQETEKGQWGMVSTDGKVLFTEEFKKKPTVAVEGHFMVKNKEGLWEIYTAEAKPKKVGGEYVSATLFNDGQALVAEQNKPVSIIDKEGKVIKQLDKVDGKVVAGVYAFQGDYAKYRTGDYYGVLNRKGECVIKPNYVYISDLSDGKYIAVDKKYEKGFKADSMEIVKFSVLDEKGKVLFDVNGAKYCDAKLFVNGKLPVAIKNDGEKIWGIINEKQEVIIKPNKKFQNIGEVKGQNFTYYNGEGWGMMNMKGETLIRAKYDFLIFDGEERLIAATKTDDGKLKFKYIDSDDNEISDESFVELRPFTALDGKHALVKVTDKLWSIIDKNGKQLDNLPDMINISENHGDTYVESDFVDISALLDDIKLAKDGLDGINFSTKAKDAVEKTVDYTYRTGTKEHKATDPYWYDYYDEIQYSRDVNNVYPSFIIEYSDNLSRQTYRKEKVIDYEGYYYTYYHWNSIPTGYVWNDVHIKRFGLSFSNSGKMKGKMRLVFNALVKRFKNMGTLVKENNGACVIKLTDKHNAFIYMKEDLVMAIWGETKDANNIDIDEYKDVKEKIIDEEDSDIAEAVDTVVAGDYSYMED